jgi:hypothetical protein
MSRSTCQLCLLHSPKTLSITSHFTTMRIDSKNTTVAMRTVWKSLTLMGLVMASCSDAFSPVKMPLHSNQRVSSLRPSLSFVKIPPSTSTTTISAHRKESLSSPSNNSRTSIWKRIQRRFDVLESAGFSPDEVKIGGLFRRVKDVHNPITYIALALLVGLKYNWCFRNPYYWFAFAFCVKWYRARYVFKIPVWDRQPNWNNIITSKDQEKDLKALTCKNCGSTIFVAKTREFFFEGDTGIGGLGCFACGAKGKDNFVNERERILEDTADIDDYFEYERPLDFVSAAERRQLLKDAKGDEEAANKALLDRAGGGEIGDDAEKPESPETDATIEDAVIEDDAIEDDVIEEEEKEPEEESDEDMQEESIEELKESDAVDESEPDVVEAPADEIVDVVLESTPEPEVETKAEPKKASKAAPTPAPKDDDDGMDVLDMD